MGSRELLNLITLANPAVNAWSAFRSRCSTAIVFAVARRRTRDTHHAVRARHQPLLPWV